MPHASRARPTQHRLDGRATAHTGVWYPMTPSTSLKYGFKLFNKHKREWDI